MTTHDGPSRSAEAVASEFQVLAHPIRAGVLQALQRSEAAPTYTDLREQVGVTDKGKFNYHLGELQEQLVRKEAGRYRLTPAGRRVCESITAGAFASPPDRRVVDTVSACQECGGRLAAVVEESVVRLTCGDCGARLRSVPFPAGTAATYDDGALLDAVDATLRQRLSSLGAGICPRCRGPTSITATTDEWERGRAPRSLRFGFRSRCRSCRGRWTTTAGETVLDHPALAGFYHDHGIDIRDRYVWELEFAVTDHDTRVRSRDPLELELRPRCGDEELVLLVDDEGTVTRSSRHTKDTARGVWFDRPAEVV